MQATLIDFDATVDVPGPAPVDPPAPPAKLLCTRKGAVVSHVGCGGQIWPSGTMHWPGKGKVLIGYTGICEKCRAEGNFHLDPPPYEKPKATNRAPTAAELEEHGDAVLPRKSPPAPAGDAASDDRPRNLIQVIEFCKRHKLPAEVVGRWVWLEFDSKPAQETRDLLKAAGFRWVAKRGKWAHNCGHYCRHGVGDPREKYGAVPVGQFADDAA